jgi:hypothetical protein
MKKVSLIWMLVLVLLCSFSGFAEAEATSSEKTSSLKTFSGYLEETMTKPVSFRFNRLRVWHITCLIFLVVLAIFFSNIGEMAKISEILIRFTSSVVLTLVLNWIFIELVLRGIIK